MKALRQHTVSLKKSINEIGAAKVRITRRSSGRAARPDRAVQRAHGCHGQGDRKVPMTSASARSSCGGDEEA